MKKNCKLLTLAPLFLLLITSSGVQALQNSKALEKKLKGTWILKSVTCNGTKQDLGNLFYSLSFEGKKGSYISKKDKCKQVEPEIYEYVSENEVTIKQGVRTCEPTPCEADLPATQCGVETNPQIPKFEVKFENQKTIILSTSDPKSIDCVGAGQSKPAVFTFVK